MYPSGFALTLPDSSCSRLIWSPISFIIHPGSSFLASTTTLPRVHHSRTCILTQDGWTLHHIPHFFLQERGFSTCYCLSYFLQVFGLLLLRVLHPTFNLVPWELSLGYETGSLVLRKPNMALACQHCGSHMLQMTYLFPWSLFPFFFLKFLACLVRFFSS